MLTLDLAWFTNWHFPSWSPLRDYQEADDERKMQLQQIRELERELDELQARYSHLRQSRV